MYSLKINAGKVSKVWEFEKVGDAKKWFEDFKPCLMDLLKEELVNYVKVSLLKNCHEIGWIVWESNGIGDLIVRSWADSSFNTNWVK